MTTMAQWIGETRYHLMGETRDEIDVLATTMNSSVTSVVATDGPASLQAGALLSVDLELMIVRSYDTATKTATVVRAQFGSVAAAHNAGAVIYVNPTVTDFAILRALNEELWAISSPANGLFRIAAINLTYNPAVSGYDLTGVTGLLDVYRVNYNPIGPENRQVRINSWRLERNQPTTEFASGFGLVLNEGADPGSTLRVQYKARYTALSTTDTSTDVATSGIHTEAADIPPLGAAVRLSAPDELSRNTLGAQPSPRRSDEVPPGAGANSVAPLARLRAQRIGEEAAALKAMYP